MVDKDRVEGSAKQGAGKVKEWAGKVTGDSKTEAEGKGDQVKGKIQNTIGGLRSTPFAASEAFVLAPLSDLTPSAMQPEPLLGIFADPAFDHRRDRLHRALDVDAAVGVAHRLDRVGHFAPEAVAVGLADDAHAVDRHSVCRASIATSGLARHLRPKNVTSTPLL